MKKIVVRVTREDIRKGDSHGVSCPIARAANRRLKGDPLLEKYALKVGCTQVYLRETAGGYHSFSHTLTKKARRFVERFDENRKLVKPGRFQLTLPDVDVTETI